MACEYGFTVSDMIKEGRVKMEDVEVMKDWLKDEKLPKYTDEMVVLFLMACDSDIEATKNCAKEYFFIRNDCPELFSDRDLTNEDIVKQWNVLNIAILPERTNEGYAVMFCGLEDSNPWSYNYVPACKVQLMTFDALTYENPPKGLVCLYDMKGMSLMHLTRIHLSIMRRSINYVQEGMNLKLKAVHIINVTWFIDKMIKFIAPFTKPEVLQLLHFHTSDMDIESFSNECIPKRCIPSNYGGEGQSVLESKNQTWKKLEELKKFFIQEEKLRKIS